jgi:predicted ribosome quality control (RQC) complex YloA/Tae2 family protein
VLCSIQQYRPSIPDCCAQTLTLLGTCGTSHVLVCCEICYLSTCHRAPNWTLCVPFHPCPQQMSADYDALQREQDKALESEKRAQADLDRVRNELTTAQLAQQEMQHQLGNEINNLRRELQEQRNKSKLVLENRTRVEMEMMNLRSEMGKMEMDAHKQNVAIKEGESAQKALEESLETTKAQLTAANENCARLKGAVGELEDGLQRKNGTIDGLKEELLQLEREGVQEIRRLR